MPSDVVPAAAPPPAAMVERPQSPFRRAMIKLRQDRAAMTAAVVLLIVIILALAAPFYASTIAIPTRSGRR